jgi:hypothetical protein
VPEIELLLAFKKRGEALNGIIALIDDSKLSEGERLKEGKSKGGKGIA